jgi:protein-disulfide isomerase
VAVGAVALWMMVATAQVWAGDCENPSQVLARVGDKTITLGDLQKKEAAKLLNASYGFYSAEHEALQSAIDDALLDREAKKEHLTVDQLLDKHVKGEIKQPSDEALRIYYIGVETDQPYETIKDKIKEHIIELQKRKLGAKYLEKLRAQSDVIVSLEPPKLDVAVGNAPVQGPHDAAVTLIEYADYECPYCRKVEPTLERLRKQYGDKVAFAFKNFPLPMHSHAEKAAEAANCAAQQGKFWQFHDKLFSDNSLDVPALKKLAVSTGLDGTKFDKCLDSGQQYDAVQKELAEGTKLGLSGTPSFFVNGHFISGNVSYDVLQGIVDQQLADAGAGNRMESSASKPESKEDKASPSSGGL